jgi:hypothetical protein
MAIFLAIIQRDNKKGEKMRITETPRSDMVGRTVEFENEPDLSLLIKNPVIDQQDPNKILGWKESDQSSDTWYLTKDGEYKKHSKAPNAADIIPFAIKNGNSVSFPTFMVDIDENGALNKAGFPEPGSAARYHHPDPVATPQIKLTQDQQEKYLKNHAAYQSGNPQSDFHRNYSQIQVKKDGKSEPLKKVINQNNEDTPEFFEHCLTKLKLTEQQKKALKQPGNALQSLALATEVVSQATQCGQQSPNKDDLIVEFKFENGMIAITFGQRLKSLTFDTPDLRQLCMGENNKFIIQELTGAQPAKEMGILKSTKTFDSQGKASLISAEITGEPLTTLVRLSQNPVKNFFEIRELFQNEGMALIYLKHFKALEKLENFLNILPSARLPFYYTDKRLKVAIETTPGWGEAGISEENKQPMLDILVKEYRQKMSWGKTILALIGRPFYFIFDLIRAFFSNNQQVTPIPQAKGAQGHSSTFLYTQGPKLTAEIQSKPNPQAPPPTLTGCENK